MAALDMHLPVLSVNREASGGLSTPKAYVYGTAFPIAKGLFATASHVLEAAQQDGTPCLSRFVGGGGQLPAHAVTRSEAFPEIDFALLECPELDWVVGAVVLAKSFMRKRAVGSKYGGKEPELP